MILTEFLYIYIYAGDHPMTSMVMYIKFFLHEDKVSEQSNNRDLSADPVVCILLLYINKLKPESRSKPEFLLLNT